jgi:hypothetical protein
LFTEDSLNLIEATRNGIFMDPADICSWIMDLTSAPQNKPRLDFSNPEDLSAEDYQTLLPCSKAAFNNMYTLIRPRMRASSNRQVQNALAMVLMILRLNLTQRFIGFLFRVDQQVVSLAVSTVADLLTELYVPEHLGYGHISRDQAIAQHSLGLFNELFGKYESLFLIVDG